jgi:hypothetical protein
MGNTGVDSMSSINKSGRDCCDASCMGVDTVKRTEWRRRRTGVGRDGLARLKLRKSRVRGRVPLTRSHSLAHFSPSGRCRPSQSCNSLNQSRSTMPYIPQSRCAPISPSSSRSITRSSGVRMHGSRHRGYAPSRRLLRQCHSNIESGWRG